MDKYSGMNKVDVKIAKNEQVKTKKKKARGYARLLLIQAAIALCLGGAALAGKQLGGDKATQKVKEAVCFDAFAFVAELIEGD